MKIKTLSKKEIKDFLTSVKEEHTDGIESFLENTSMHTKTDKNVIHLLESDKDFEGTIKRFRKKLKIPKDGLDFFDALLDLWTIPIKVRKGRVYKKGNVYLKLFNFMEKERKEGKKWESLEYSVTWFLLKYGLGYRWFLNISMGILISGYSFGDELLSGIDLELEKRAVTILIQERISKAKLFRWIENRWPEIKFRMKKLPQPIKITNRNLAISLFVSKLLEQKPKPTFKEIARELNEHLEKKGVDASYTYSDVKIIYHRYKKTLRKLVEQGNKYWEQVGRLQKPTVSSET